jgi:ring-1,2-phenylacetyl-CoA epoxidase subunit PaaC
VSTPRDSSPPPLRSSDEQSRGGPAPTADSAAEGAFGYVLALADDALVSAQRMGWWISRAPQLEEDVALANIGLDQLGQARMLLARAGELEGAGRGEDDLAYFRDERDFRNVHLVERDQSDFGVAMARLLLFAAWQRELYAALRTSADATVAGAAGKAVKEVDYHLDHAAHWVLRLGDGTEESHRRMQSALDDEWRYLEELFDGSWLDAGVVESGVAVDPATLREPVLARIVPVVEEATLAVPEVTPAVGGGRRGLHTEQMGYLLAEMQHLTRSHPGATW